MKTRLLVLVILFSQVGMGQTSDRKSLELSPTTTITEKAFGLTISIVVTTSEVKTGDLLGSRILDSQFPETVRVIRDIKMSVNGKALFVPRSTFADLFWVRDAGLALTRKSSALVITGGDGIESFLLRIEFDRTRVKRRALFSPTGSDKPLQETIYYERPLG